jgi:L-asparaginase II
MHEPLLVYKRGELAEITVYGAISWVSGGKLVHQYGGDAAYYLRSLAKPLQIKCFAGKLDGVLSWPQKALALSSHCGEREQLITLESMAPLHRGRSAVAASHPCSGNHGAVLCLCQVQGWDFASYQSAAHPYHKASFQILGEKTAAFGGIHCFAEDGCGFFTPGMRLSAMAHLYADLAQRKDVDWIWSAMQRHPELVGGLGRVDSAVLRLGEGRLLAKEGADGLLGLGVLHPRFPEGLGMVIKLSHGADTRSMGLITRAVLSTLDFPPLPLDTMLQQQPQVDAGVVPEFLRR